MKWGVEGALCAMTEESEIGSITYELTSQSEDWTWLVSVSHSYSDNISRAKEHSLTQEFGLRPDVKSIWKKENGSQYVETSHDILCGLCKRKKRKKTAIWNPYPPLHATNVVRDYMSNARMGFVKVYHPSVRRRKKRRQGIEGGTKDQNRETYSSLLQCKG